VGEVVGLQIGDQLAPAQVEAHPAEPGLEQAASVVGADVDGDLALAHGSLADHPFRHLQDGSRVRLLRSHFFPHIGSKCVLLVGIRQDEGPGRQGHRRVGPLGGAALLAARFGVAAAQVA
jgi:hypothetical protein